MLMEVQITASPSDKVFFYGIRAASSADPIDGLEDDRISEQVIKYLRWESGSPLPIRCRCLPKFHRIPVNDLNALTCANTS